MNCTALATSPLVGYCITGGSILVWSPSSTASVSSVSTSEARTRVSNFHMRAWSFSYAMSIIVLMQCRISKDKIGDMSIKLQFNQEEIWTRALRHVLLALKILLKWTTSGNA
jgi:uncharacterized membrane protein